MYFMDTKVKKLVLWNEIELIDFKHKINSNTDDKIHVYKIKNNVLELATVIKYVNFFF